MGKKSTTTTTQTVYGNTTTTNPYATATTNNGGTTATFKKGTAFDTIYDVVNNNINSLLDEYLNPSLNSVTNQAKLKAYTDNLNRQALKSFENTVINPLSARNMIRSSQATDLYKNLSNQTSSSLENYIANLIAESQSNSAKMINNLLAAYLSGYNLISDMQNQSLRTSAGNSATTSTSSGNSNSALSAILPLMMNIAGL